MNLLESILTSQNGAAVQQLGSQFGLGEDQTTAALSALVPVLAGAVHQNAQTPDGLAGLITALTGGNHQQYVDNPAMLGHADTLSDGNAILGHVLGSKDASRAVATQAAADTGIGADVLKQMLPMAAALVMGAMSRHATTTAASRNAATQGSVSLAPNAGSDLTSMIGAALGQGSVGSPAEGLDLGALLGKFLAH